MGDGVSDDTPAASGDQQRQALAAELSAALGDALVETHLQAGQNLWLRVEINRWHDALATLRDAGFTYFGFLSVIDWADAPEGRYEDTQFDAVVFDSAVSDTAGLGDVSAGQNDDAGVTDTATAVETVRLGGGETRFQLLAQLHSPARRAAVLVKADVAEVDGATAPVPTVIDVFAGADWHEREAHEMFGLAFDGHPNLQPIYLPTEFEGHPLRKDFPLLARAVKPWPGVVDIEEIPPELEAQLEAEVMAEFEASGAGA
ncbi:NADH-quinone oxidoreductase subunit C [Candidatus Poriferisodalis sp.]|uniref:NADH-quinone oxidoreductase subunit C n=1 Tax=Candidatus Poriferisodalis sp. TaxID=3101277 RepID=UPI003B01EB54